ncbi:glycosyltransferase family 4 protein [Paraburkholderia sp. XV]|uniref:glycosyltransferase family 4 protein n=1 Tax=Paraburkholderia sp. XV TaxID=2831520 RepID=UPI001CD2FFD2|nr:glycosyltransferase family 4 protein [Paraburkholderia sp. XV]
MRIAQVSTLYERVPPVAYGGTERVVSWLTEELVARGHELTLFASGDSLTRAELVPVCPRSLRDIEDTADPQAFHVAMLEQVVQRSGEFDIVHFHTDYASFPFGRRVRCPHLTTLHWRLDIPGLDTLYREFADMPLVSISDAQRAPLPDLAWQCTIYHGLPPGLLSFHPAPSDYLAFVGRIAPAKRPDTAIEIARRARARIEIAAKIDNGDRAYYERDIAPLMKQPHVCYRGELDDWHKNDFVGRARALLFPVDWPEPFGLVLAEALACGTPVIAFGRGSVPEIIDDGVTGFIVNTIDEAVEAVGKIDTIDRSRCRAAFEKRFTVARMAD